MYFLILRFRQGFAFVLVVPDRATINGRFRCDCNLNEEQMFKRRIKAFTNLMIDFLLFSDGSVVCFYKWCSLTWRQLLPTPVSSRLVSTKSQQWIAFCVKHDIWQCLQRSSSSSKLTTLNVHCDHIFQAGRSVFLKWIVSFWTLLRNALSV